MGAEPPSHEQIAELLDLAVRAPNHHRTEPWRFYVLQGDMRDRLARAMAAAAIDGGAPEERAIEDARVKVQRAPMIVVFTALPSNDPKVVEQEEIVAAAMAMQNFLIGAHASGLGAMLRTGPGAYHPSVNEHLDLAPHERVVGLVYIGLPDADRPVQERQPASQRTTWLG